MPNSLEDLLVKSVKKSEKEYLKLTGGYPLLWHAPESFVQMQIARDISASLGVNVYPECTPINLAKDTNTQTQIGRPPKINNQQRFDLVVWWKNENYARAIIEVKLTEFSMLGVIKDGQKLLNFQLRAKSHVGLKQGYLVVYNCSYRKATSGMEGDSVKKIKQRFEKTSLELSLLGAGKHFSLVGEFISKEQSTSNTHKGSFGIAVWRLNFG